MANNDFYDILGISKGASDADIKKAYKKKAMEWHPDRHKGDKKAEEKFKKINQAYETLKDSKKRQQYDTFGKTGEGFSGFSGGQGFGGFEDLFRNAGGGRRTHTSSSFDFGDIFDMFGQGGANYKTSDFRSQKTTPKEEEKVDVTKIYEVPILDLILGTKLDIETVYSEWLKLKIPEGTRPGTKFKIKGKGRKTGSKTGDMYVLVEAKMPKNIPENAKKLLESIRGIIS